MVQLKKADPFADFAAGSVGSSVKDQTEVIRQLHVLVPMTMQTRLRVLAAEKGLRMSELVRDVLDEYLAKNSH